MIELTVKELVNSIDSLKELIQKDLRAKVAYQVARLVREVEKETNLFEERRNELVKKYAKRDEDGEIILKDNTFSVAQENIDKFVDELNEMIDSKVELNVEKIELKDLDCDLTANQMIALMVFINE